jgi:hypothetical protein
MRQKIPKYLKKATAKRAKYCCEYCRIPDMDSYYTFESDHIISLKHGGLTIITNLAYACPDCNRFKGTDLGTFLGDTQELIRFYNPRTDKWRDHFETDETGYIIPLTKIGEATIKIFMINHPDRIIERQLLWKLGLMN